MIHVIGSVNAVDDRDHDFDFCFFDYDHNEDCDPHNHDHFDALCVKVKAIVSDDDVFQDFLNHCDA